MSWLHPVAQIDHARNLGNGGHTLQDAADAVLRQRTEAALQRVVLQVADAGAARDQVVYVAVDLEYLHDRLPSGVPLVLAVIAAGGAVDRDVHVVAHAE